MTLSLNAAARDSKTKLDDIRSAGNIPAVYYGAKVDSTPISIDDKLFRKVYKEAGESTMITLETSTGPVSVLVQDMQIDPVSGQVLHVDFKAVEANKPVTVTVPLEFMGEAPAAKQGLGTLTKVTQEIEVEALPKDLPSSIEVDLSVIDTMESQILVQDLKLPNGVSAVTEAESVIAVMAAIKEESDEAAGEIDFSAIEVEKKGKAEEGGAES